MNLLRLAPAKGVIMKFTPALAAVVLLSATACSTIGDDEPAKNDEGKITDVVLATHDSFALPKELVKKFETDTGYHLVIRPNGDAGELTSKLVLTKDDPIGDVAFGVDNTFAGRATSEDVFAPYDVALPAGADAYALTGDGADTLAPIDTGDVCVNVDTDWFTAHEQAPPKTLDDLTKPAYQDLFVTEGAPTSSPGFAFLLATIAAKGDGWQDYWTALMDNGTKVVNGWEEAYTGEFTAASKHGTRPIVVSYDSSPAFTINAKAGTTSTQALLDTCFRQVEYAGVLAGAKNEPGAEAVIEFLLSPEVQAALPENMYVFPVRDGVTLPVDWAKFAKQPTETFDVPAADIDANRKQWLTDWTDITSK